MKNLYKKILKNIYFWWLQRDFNKHLNLLENFKLKKNIKKQVKKGIKNELKETGEVKCKDTIEKADKIVDIFSSVIINMYAEYEYIPAEKKDIYAEAEFISKRFIEAYKNSKSNENIDIISYLGIPKEEIKRYVELNNIKEKIEKESENIDVNSLDFTEKLDEILNFIKSKSGKKNKLKPGINNYALGLWYICNQCVNDIRTFSAEYNINYVDDGEQRCLFNFFNLYIHKVLFTGKLLISYEDRKIIFAASAIHPAQDDYIDSGNIDKDIIGAIYEKIEGKEVVCTDENAGAIFRLLDIIFERYSHKEHKELVGILKELHYWQIESEKQKGNNCEEDELLNISFMKGGYAFAFYGYIALGRMNMLEFRHFFGMGAIFQIMDDLHDIEIDLENKIETIWTKNIKAENTDEAINGIVEIQRMFESITGPFKTLKRPVFLRRMELFAVRFDLCKFYFHNKKYFSGDIFEQFEDLCPFVTLENIEKYKSNMEKIKTLDEFQDALMKIKEIYKEKILNNK